MSVRSPRRGSRLPDPCVHPQVIAAETTIASRHGRLP